MLPKLTQKPLLSKARHQIVPADDQETQNRRLGTANNFMLNVTFYFSANLLIVELKYIAVASIVYILSTRLAMQNILSDPL
jgi:hypothetical protein